ncbi:hypothetical protein ACIGBL_31335 [Streptomyces sp. NPDC085614]|uniref:hypothetical protein n=1 Tax=unclassified Streptomyces TaxID=2593676 RepID=UPI0037D97572
MSPAPYGPRGTARGTSATPRPRGPGVRLLRGAGYAVLPAELVLAVCLVAGVRIPEPAVLAAEAATLLLLAVGAGVFVRLRRSGTAGREALAELVPEPVLRLAAHELRLLASLGLWVARRRVGVRAGDTPFPHARDQAALMYGFAFVCLVETVGMSYLLAGLPVVHAVVLVLDVYTVLFVLGLHAASVTRPHVLGPDGLRLRQAAHVDLLVPLERIASVRHELLFSHEKAEGELNLAVGSQTSLTVELTGPVDAPRFLGGPRPVRIVRCHADDARGLARALAGALAEARDAPTAPDEDTPSPAAEAADRVPAGRAGTTPVRTAPSPLPDPPASA